MIKIQTVNDYLALHLQAEFWDSLENAKKTEAFEKACEDVKQALSIPETDACKIFQICAVAEQALHVADNGEGFSSRALQFIEREKII